MSASNMALDFKKLQARYPCNEKTDPYAILQYYHERAIPQKMGWEII